MSSVIKDVRERQRVYRNLLVKDPQSEPSKHRPEMLLMGCVDARINVKDLGIPDGKALIYRSVGATVDGLDAQGHAIDPSEAAAIEFAVKHMHVKDIVVMGHTNCGGMRACIDGACHSHAHGEEKEDDNSFLTQFLQPFKDVAQGIGQRFGLEANSSDTDKDKAVYEMEKAAIARSIENLQTYPFVQQAIEAGELHIHGWLLDTGTKLLQELDINKGTFKPMAEYKPMSERFIRPTGGGLAPYC